MPDFDGTANSALPAKRKCRADKKEPQVCAICDKIGKYKYYNVLSCQACKQFFRRVVLVRCEYVCGKWGNCNPIRENCRSCRLDKCLRVGMDPNLVVAKEACNSTEFIEKLLKRKEELLQRSEGHDSREIVLLPAAFELALPERGEMGKLVQLVHRHHRIWSAGVQMSSEYLNRHDSLADFLGDRNNLLGKAEQFLDWPLAKNFSWQEEVLHGPFGMFGECVNSRVRDSFLAIEFAKAMPLFRTLDLNEKVAILNRALSPAIMLFCAFYSAEMGVNVWQRVDGFQAVDPFVKSERFGGDQKIIHFCKMMFCDTVDSVSEAQIGREELALLLAIIFTNADCDVSQSTRSLLYQESAGHSKQLLQLLQAKHGQMVGAKRFVIAMSLLNVAIKHKYNHLCMLNYMEAFNHCAEMQDGFFVL